MRFRGILAAVLLVAVHALQAARAADDLIVEAQRQGDSIELRARATIAAPASLVWAVLTDYESLAVTLNGKSIGDVIELSIADSLDYFATLPLGTEGLAPEIATPVTETGRPPSATMNADVAGTEPDASASSKCSVIVPALISAAVA